MAMGLPGCNCSGRKYSSQMGQKTAYIRFYEELNDFLTPSQVKKDLPCHFYNSPSVKDLIESFGVPHTEVDLILINGEPVGFEKQIRHQDRISVYPRFESLDISPVSVLRGRPLRDIRFVLDVHLGKLARYLRLCGFDTLYDNTFEDHEIVSISTSQHRVILTRDIGILKYSMVQHGYWLRSDQPEQQLKEVIRRFDLKEQIRLFNRCMECNGIIQPVDKQKVEDKLPEGTRKYYQEFYQCRQCGKIYWKGSHYYNMIKRIDRLIG